MDREKVPSPQMHRKKSRKLLTVQPEAERKPALFEHLPTLPATGLKRVIGLSAAYVTVILVITMLAVSSAVAI